MNTFHEAFWLATACGVDSKFGVARNDHTLDDLSRVQKAEPGIGS